jgi:hypothetical protein
MIPYFIFLKKKLKKMGEEINWLAGMAEGPFGSI